MTGYKAARIAAERLGRGYTPDAIYSTAAGILGLYAVAFYRWRMT